MDIKTLLNKKRERILVYIDEFLEEKHEEWATINAWGPDAIKRLKVFISKGKMVRGAFVLSTAELFGVEEQDALPVAAAMEFIQAALLAHDDIMDNDAIRRGMPALHKQYELFGEEKNIPAAGHFGMSMSICLGDLAIFLAYELLAKTNNAHIIDFFSKRIAIVGLGQMQDVYWGLADIIPLQKEILSMYEHKTAMYTFCLPFTLGALVARQQGNILQQLETLGKHIGILFQIKDDELGLYGDGDVLGKSIGIDIVTGKKTIYYATLVAQATQQEKEELARIQHSGKINAQDVAFFHELLEKYDVTTSVQEITTTARTQAEELIAQLLVSIQGKETLTALLQYVLERNS
ncbi:polyprenyl synthetase family protein [Candidatus Woesearchaeota archaeon]|nr:polyprenyl synthetase family protein [Candidatus Woesearchaeota archaeon]